MAKYRKKPVVIEAVQWTGDNPEQVEHFLESTDGVDSYYYTTLYEDGEALVIRTLEGNMAATPGDWIIKGVQGEFYPCKPDIFEQTYELVE